MKIISWLCTLFFYLNWIIYQIKKERNDYRTLNEVNSSYTKWRRCNINYIKASTKRFLSPTEFIQFMNRRFLGPVSRVQISHYLLNLTSYSIWSDWIISYFTQVALSGSTWRTCWFGIRTFLVSWIWLPCWPCPCWFDCWIWMVCPCCNWSPPFCCELLSIWNTTFD